MSKRTSGALSYLLGSPLSSVYANLLAADVIIGRARYVRPNLTLQLRATWREGGGIAKCTISKRISGALSYLPGSSLPPVCANLLTADVIIGGARYVRTNSTLRLRATWSKGGGIAKVYHEERTSGALRYLPGSSLSPVCANLLTADVIIRGAHYGRILSHKYGLNVGTKHIVVLPQKHEMKRYNNA
ncbi:hypothetical protein B0H13DRAFT_1875945 [Mycena leptocephala]|nr:hypothetical protein B0H13DRAFT_1875945 [Mycena leptocephala]